ncbi:unnamed protein product [Plutella xylostella]|nr:unnamed protein product [Plutella xylostella]
MGTLLWIGLLMVSAGAGADMTLGGIFYEDDVDMQSAFNLSTRMYNFTSSMRTVQRGQILEVSEHVCDLVKEGLIGIIDGTGGRSSEHIQAVCDMLEVPHVLVQHNDLFTANWSILNLYPSGEAYNTALEKLITHKGWQSFTVLYVKGHILGRVDNLFRLGNETSDMIVSVRELSGEDYRDVLIEAKESEFTNFVVDCPSQNIELVLNHSQQVGLLADEHSYIFLSPDLFTLDLTQYRYGGVNVTGFRLMDLKQNKKMWEYTADLNEETGQTREPEEIKTEVVLIHDAVKVFYEALKKVAVEPQELSCDNYDSWAYGSSLLNFMRTNKINGITRQLLFDGFGQRTNINLEIMELTPAGNQSIGEFNNGLLDIQRPVLPVAQLTSESIMKNKTFIVLISTTAPYGYIKESLQELEGNDRYEGFTVDLIEELSKLLEFSYEFREQNKYGTLYANGKWDGMVAEIMDEKADFGICDFTITSDRQRAIDFSVPFMTLGIGILYKEPSKQPPEMFSFMAVFSTEVWIWMLFAQIGLGVVMIFVGRISHKEWQNPVPCIEDPDEFSNQFSFANSVWLIIGSVMQQGSEIAPIALAPRMITSVWWFFTMVMVASYTGTLVAFLTVEKNVLPFTNVEELYRHKSISYGAKKDGSTINFFRDSKNEIYQKMYSKMKSNPGWLVTHNDIAVSIAEEKNYAAFMESTSIEYYKERHCDLLQIGELLDTKSYGIGMKKGSEYKKHIDDALLTLKERGDIQKLKDIWWKEKRGGGKCGVKRDEEQKQLTLRNMVGAFVVLGVGCLLGLLISTLDMLWGVFKRSLKYQTTFQYELVEELKFALTFSGDVKPVRRRPTEGSSEALADDPEAKDELKSLRSVRSSDTHRTHHSHSHSSRHSSRSQSVAFARMRSYD